MNLRLGAIAILVAGLVAGTSSAVDPSGTWRWEHEDLAGTGEIIKDVLKLKFDDGKVSGTYAGPGDELEIENAKIDGDTVVVSSEDIAQPITVRYAWADNPVCNLYNRENLPASPFRTDSWPGITAENK